MPDGDIGGLEDVAVEDIKKAWAICRVQMRAAQSAIRSARREFLAAGFGIDHPVCQKLDSHDACMEDTWAKFLRTGGG